MESKFYGDPQQLLRFVTGMFRNGKFFEIVNIPLPAFPIISLVDAKVLEIVAVANAQLKRFDQAEEHFKELIRFQPGYGDHRANYGAMLLDAARPEEALEILKGANELFPDNDSIKLNLGFAAFSCRNYPEAVRALRDIYSRYPQLFKAGIYLAGAMQEMADLDAASQVIKGMPIELDLDLPDRYQYASILSATDHFERAEVEFEHLLERYPDEWIALVNLANLRERGNNLTSARQLLERVPSESKKHPLFLAANGRVLAREGNELEAISTFDAALAAADENIGVPLDRFCSDLEFDRGKVLDRIGEYDAAYQAFSRANILIRDNYRQYHPAIGEGKRIDWLCDDISADKAVKAAARRKMPEDNLILIVGFPRSGTTLLDQMLDAHPELQVMEEKPALEGVVAAIDRMPGRHPAALSGLTEDDISDLRDLYWKNVNRFVRRRPGTHFIDKYPLNLARIQLVMMLFPKAKWIFAIRHPYDVVLSCFSQHFRFTNSTHGFWSLEQTASLYEQFMSLWLSQRARLKPDCFDLRYEALVSDFEVQARRLIEFLEIDWDDSVLSYHKHAKTRRINTPSYNQVVQPIYKTATGRWRNYEQYIGEVKPILEPFLRPLGYQADS